MVINCARLSVVLLRSRWCRPFKQNSHLFQSESGPVGQKGVAGSPGPEGVPGNPGKAGLPGQQGLPVSNSRTNFIPMLMAEDFKKLHHQ